MTVNVYNLIILVGAVGGLTLSAMLILSRKSNRPGNLLLALLLIFYTLPVVKVVLLDMGFYRYSGLWFLSIELLYGLGPSLFLYCKTASDPEYRLSKVDLLHFSPVVLEIAYYFSPLYPEPGHFIFTAARSIYHLIWMIEQSGGIVSIFIYLFLTNKLLRDHRKWVATHYSNTLHRSLIWLRRPVVIYSVFFVLWFSLRVVDVIYFGDTVTNGPYYPLLIFLSFSTYWIGTKGYLESQIDAAGFSLARHEPIDNPADEVVLDAIYEELEGVMSIDRLYLDNDLSLTLLAQQLGVNQRLLSQAINTRAKMNFYDFVNQYRIEAFKRRALLPGAPKTLIELAMQCGFGSKATFNHVFKQSTGLTPTQFKKNAIANENNLDFVQPGQAPEIPSIRQEKADP